MLVIVVVIIVIILLDDDVRLNILDKYLGLAMVVADVKRALARSARAGCMKGRLTRLRLLGTRLALEDTSTTRTGRVSAVGLASMSTSVLLSFGLRETMTVLGWWCSWWWPTKTETPCS